MSMEAIRRSLFVVLASLDPDEAARVGRDANATRLLELVRSCRPLPAEFVRFVLEHSDREPACDSLTGGAAAAWNAWLLDKGFPPIDATIESSRAPERLPTHVPPRERESRPFPREWNPLVHDIRERLFGSIPQMPFSEWILPQPLWHGAWAEAFAVISPDEFANAAAIVLVPSEDAADSSEALEAWRARVAAATRLSTNPVRARAGLITKIVGCAVNATPSYVLLERLPHGPRTLAERLRGADVPTPAQLLQLAIALCELLTSLAAAHVRILDLRPEVVAFEHSEGLRLTQLLDPTAVWPIADLVPELRLAGSSLATTLADPGVSERVQVFMVAALTLGVLRNTTESLRAPTRGSGCAVSFATLAGFPELADSDHDRIVEPLIDDLRQTYSDGPDWVASQTLVRICRWALSEEPDERHQSLAELAASFRGLSEA